MAFGIADHSVTGNIGSIKEQTVNEKLVLNVNVAVTPYQRGDGEAKTTWYQTTLWGEKANAFKKCDFAKGDLVHMKLQDLKAEAYLSKDDEPKAALVANVQDFTDLRQRAKNQQDTKQETDSSPKQETQASETPKTKGGSKSKMK